LIKKQKSLKIIQVDPFNPSHDQILEAYRIVQNGGVIMFPTQHLYGLGAAALNIKAVDRVFEIKQRPHNKPLLVLIYEQKNLTKLVEKIPSTAIRIMECFWPGALTIVFEAKKALPKNLTAGTGKIGVRMPRHPVALALARALKSPITATSANITGNSGCSRVSEVDPLIAGKLDLILDAGPLKGGIGSTVVDVTHDFPKILREGAIPAKDIFAVLGGTDTG